MDGPPRCRSIVRVVEEPHALVHSSRIEFATIEKQVHGDGERKCNCEPDQNNEDNRGKKLIMQKKEDTNLGKVRQMIGVSFLIKIQIALKKIPI